MIRAELYKITQVWRVCHFYSDSKVEATTSEALLGTCLGLDASVTLSVGLLLSFLVVLLATLLLVVSSLHLLQFTSETLNLILVLVDLRLVHVEFSSHSLHLVGLLLQVLLVDRELFSDFGTGLTSKEVLEFDIELLFLLDDDILLNDFLGLLDETFLERLNLLEHLPSIRVCTFKLPPSVVVEGVFKLLRKSLD